MYDGVLYFKLEDYIYFRFVVFYFLVNFWDWCFLFRGLFSLLIFCYVFFEYRERKDGEERVRFCFISILMELLFLVGFILEFFVGGY